MYKKIIIFILVIICSYSLSQPGYPSSYKDTLRIRNGTYSHPGIEYYCLMNFVDTKYAEIPNNDIIVLYICGKQKQLGIVTHNIALIDTIKKDISIQEIYFNMLYDEGSYSKYSKDFNGKIFDYSFFIPTGKTTLFYRSEEENQLNLHKSIILGERFPDIELSFINGISQNISDLTGKIVVINSWGTWCNPCLVEIPGLNQLTERFESDNVVFIAIAKDSKTKIEDFLLTHTFSFKHAIHTSESLEIFNAGFPHNIIINKDGYVYYSKVGGNKDTYKAIEKKLIILINNK